MKNASRLPNCQYEFDKRLISVDKNEDDTLLIIKNSTVTKAQRWNNLSIRMINNSFLINYS